MTTWIKMHADSGSWHAIGTWTRVPDHARTLCGRTADGPTSDTLPSGRGCETCDRAVLRGLEPKPDNDPVPA